MQSLTKILDSTEFVLIDSSIHGNSKNNPSFLKQIYNATNYECINFESIQSEIESYQNFLEILNHASTRTIPEVTAELNQYSQIVGNKIRYISDKHSNGNSAHIRCANTVYGTRTPKRTKRINEWNNKKRNALIDLVELSFLVCTVSKSKYPDFIKKPEYKILTNMVKEISKEFKLKKDSRALHGDKPHDPYSSDTDEKLTASLYMAALSGIENPALATRDSDFIPLVSVAYSIMSSDKFSPHNQKFCKTISENPFELYLQAKPGSEVYFCPFENNPVFSRKRIILKDIFLGRAIAYLWRKYSRIYEKIPTKITIV